MDERFERNKLDTYQQGKQERDKALDQLAEFLFTTDRIPSFQEAVQAFRNKKNPEDVFRSFFAKFPIMEVWTREYIQGLVEHIHKTLRDAKLKGTVLEIGAAEGWLSQRLRMMSGQTFGKADRFAATDDFSYPYMKQVKLVFPVEHQDYKDAVKTHKPSIVICSGMDPGIDMTPELRAISSIKEYIIIGQVGQSAINSQSYSVHPGFSKIRLPELSRYQISTWDTLTAEEHHQASETVAFKRN